VIAGGAGVGKKTLARALAALNDGASEVAAAEAAAAAHWTLYTKYYSADVRAQYMCVSGWC